MGNLEICTVGLPPGSRRSPSAEGVRGRVEGGKGGGGEEEEGGEEKGKEGQDKDSKRNRGMPAVWRAPR